MMLTRTLSKSSIEVNTQNLKSFVRNLGIDLAVCPWAGVKKPLMEVRNEG